MSHQQMMRWEEFKRLPDLPLYLLMNLQGERHPNGLLRVYSPELNFACYSESLDLASLFLRWIWLQQLLEDSPGGACGYDRAEWSTWLLKVRADSEIASLLTQSALVWH